MTRQSEKTREAKLFATEFAEEMAGVKVLDAELLEAAKARTDALEQRKLEERKRTLDKSHKDRTKEEKQHAERINQANENIQRIEGE
jgi:hypothetical protein